MVVVDFGSFVVVVVGPVRVAAAVRILPVPAVYTFVHSPESRDSAAAAQERRYARLLRAPA